MTKSPHTGQGDVGQPCAASVDYKGRKGACRREGKHPDTDGIRWWCGLHRPDRRSGRPTPQPGDDGGVEVVRTTTSVAVNPTAGEKKTKPRAIHAPEAPSSKVVDRSVLVSASQAQVADSVALEALEVAQQALVEISNTNTVGWDETKPIENYKVLIAHMADRAREASSQVTAAIRQLKT